MKNFIVTNALCQDLSFIKNSFTYGHRVQNNIVLNPSESKPTEKNDIKA